MPRPSSDSLLRQREAATLRSEQLTQVALMEITSLYSGRVHVRAATLKSLLVAICALSNHTRPLTNDEIGRTAGVGRRQTQQGIRSLVRAGFVIEQCDGADTRAGKWYRVSIDNYPARSTQRL